MKVMVEYAYFLSFSIIVIKSIAIVYKYQLFL